MSSAPPQSIDSRLTQLSRSLEELKSAYELYFSGQLRVEPAKEHAAWKRDYLLLQNLDAKSTGQKFRLRNLQARYTQLSGLWTKICKQIEEGTYKREKFLIKAKNKKESSTSKSQKASAGSDALIQSIYKKLSDASAKIGRKIPNIEEFSSTMAKEIQNFKKLHPKEKLEVKLVKDKSGNFRVQLQSQQKK